MKGKSVKQEAAMTYAFDLGDDQKARKVFDDLLALPECRGCH